MTYIDIDDKYNDKNKDEYFAAIYPIKYTNQIKDWHEPAISSPKDILFVSLSNQITENTVSQNYYHINKDKYRMLPIIKDNLEKSKNIQRDIIAVWGASGSGKSHLIDMICKMNRLVQDRKMYYISSKNMPIDPSFNSYLYDQFFTLDQFLELFMEDADIKAFETNKLFDGSVLIFDDLIFENKTIKIKFYKILNIVLTLKRMNNISVIYCFHEQTDFLHTRTLFNELTQYICYPSMDIKNRSNRVLVDYFKLSKSEIDYINTVKNTRWVCVNTKKRAVITEHNIKLLD